MSSEHLKRVHSSLYICTDCEEYTYPIVPNKTLATLRKDHEAGCKGKPRSGENDDNDNDDDGNEIGAKAAVRMTKDQENRWKQWKDMKVPFVMGEKKPQTSWRKIHKSLFPGAQTFPSMFIQHRDDNQNHLGPSITETETAPANAVNEQDTFPMDSGSHHAGVDVFNAAVGIHRTARAGINFNVNDRPVYSWHNDGQSYDSEGPSTMTFTETSHTTNSGMMGLSPGHDAMSLDFYSMLFNASATFGATGTPAVVASPQPHPDHGTGYNAADNFDQNNGGKRRDDFSVFGTGTQEYGGQLVPNPGPEEQQLLEGGDEPGDEMGDEMDFDPTYPTQM